MAKSTRVAVAVACVAAAFALAGPAGANPPLANPSFEIVGPGGSPTSNTTAAPGGAGISAADSWGVFHNTAPATTRTELLPTTLATGGSRMLHVATDGPLNGINQVTGPPGSGVTHGIASGWVFALSGVVGMGSGNHGNTGIDAKTTTTGAWEFLEAPNGQSPFNTILFYAIDGPADFYVENASMRELQDLSDRPSVEYSNAPNDEQALAGGGHGPPDPGQVLYTEPIDTPGDGNPRDIVDFFPGIESDNEPDAQVDALANGGDVGFDAVVANTLPLLVSFETDPNPNQPVAVFRERINGSAAVEYTQKDLHALDAAPSDLDDLDALEMWGPLGASDADYFSLLGDATGTSVFSWDGAGMSPYISQALVIAAVQALGYDGARGDVDVDALMLKDLGVPTRWDPGDEVLFSIRPAGNWDGGEIVHWRNGAAPTFLFHGGHDWDRSFLAGPTIAGATIENVDALEAPRGAALCDVVMSDSLYLTGDTVKMTTLRYANLSGAPLPTRLRLQLSIPFPLTIDVLDLLVTVPNGLDNDLGPVMMFTVTGQPEGSYEMRCAFEDPITGDVQAEDIEQFFIRHP